MGNILWFSEIRKENLPQVGGKGANLGELTAIGAPVPNGFAITSEAYFDFIKNGSLGDKIRHELKSLSVKDSAKLLRASQNIKTAILASPVSKTLSQEIKEAYHRLSGSHDVLVAVRSSATAEDLPKASFAGQQESYLNVSGAADVVAAVHKCWASLFESRAIFYRTDMGFDHFKVGLSAVVQKMVESETSGIMFTVDPLSNDLSTISVEAVFGLGPPIVSGEITPDQYLIDKKTLKIIKKTVVPQEWQLIRKGKMIIPKAYQSEQKLSDQKIKELSLWGKKIEEHYGYAQDIEWALEDDQIYIVQARPVTTIDQKVNLKNQNEAEPTEINEKEIDEKLILTGIGASQGIVSGPVIKIVDAKEIVRVKEGDVLVARLTSPDFVPAMKRAVAIVTDEGGRTSHAAIVSRELGIACVVGTGQAMSLLRDGESVTVDGAAGKVYEGLVELGGSKEIPNSKFLSSDSRIKTATKVYINLADPEMAEKLAQKNVDGVGLLRAEFIISQMGIHPKAALAEGQGQEFSQHLAAKIAKVAQAFKPRPVVYRTTDFRTNEYRNLKGGQKYEPHEENPMIGYRGALRYVTEPEVFALELNAIATVRRKMKLLNLVVMLPFVRTVQELRETKKMMAAAGLNRGGSFKIWLMVEIPANVILLDQFLNEGLDGISVGTNDLTMLTLGADRDNAKLARYTEENEAVLKLVEKSIKTAQGYGVSSSVCGEAPSVYPSFLKNLIGWGVSSVSVDPDVAEMVRLTIARQEKEVIK